MGFFKDKRAVEILWVFSLDPVNFKFFEIGQQIRDGKSHDKFIQQDILRNFAIINEYVNYRSEEHHESAIEALAMYSLIKFGHDSEQYNQDKIAKYSEKLYISMTDKTGMFKFEHMPVINDLGNKLTNQKENKLKENEDDDQEKNDDHIEEFAEHEWDPIFRKIVWGGIAIFLIITIFSG